MYNKSFAKIYNKLWCGFSETLADNILKLNIKKKSLLDLGCGTGNFLKKLEKEFDYCAGIDISPDMIAIAKENCSKSVLEVKSVTDFSFDKKFDLITCNFDMINHLPSLSDWEKTFTLVFNHLEDGGIFIFDFNTAFKLNNLDFLEHNWKKENYTLMEKDTKLYKNHIKMHYEITNNLTQEKAIVDEVESFFEEKEILKALHNAGFKNVKFTDMNFNEVNDYNVGRLFAVCKKC